MTKRDKSIERRTRRARRHASIRKKIRGTAARPRLVVSRSLRNIEGQLVDDDGGHTILGVSTRASELPPPSDVEQNGDGENDLPGGSKVRASFAAGRLLASRAKEAGVEQIVFDRAGYRFQGRVKAFADGARAGGLKF